MKWARVLAALMTVTLLSWGGHVMAAEREWVKASSGDFTLFFNTHRIARFNGDTYKVWEKTAYPEKVRTLLGLSPDELKSYAFTVSLDLVDCQQTKLGYVSSTHYSASGDVLGTPSSVPDRSVESHDVEPGSAGEEFVLGVCRYIRKNHRGDPVLEEMRRDGLEVHFGGEKKK